MFEAGQRLRAQALLEAMRGSRSAHEATTIPVADLQGRLGAGELLLGWLCGTEQTLLFAFTQDARHVFTIAAPRTLAQKIQAVRRMLASPPHGDQAHPSARKASEELARLVLGDALPLVTKSRALILVPDGPLDLVPFSALVVKGQPLVAARPTTIALGMTLESATPAADDTAPARKLLAIQGGSGLSMSEREVEWLAGTFQGVTVSRADRSVPDSAALASYQTLHFAGRVTYDEQNPWASGVDAGRRHAYPGGAAADPPPSADGMLRAEQIAGLELGADLVVLSSCAKTSSGEGAGALATSFLAAGAHAVIVPLWPLDDRATESLVRELYRTLDAGKPVAEALRAAQDHQRRTSGTQHPYYWAGFALWGDGAARLELKPNPIWKRGTPSKR